MTKTQSLMYIGAVVAMIILGYLYTSLVAAPDEVKTAEEVAAEVTVSEPVEELHPIPGKNDLASTTWRWLRTESATGTVISEPKSNKPFLLSFADHDSMGSQTDCNSLAGSYTHGDVTLTFGQLASTKMFCEGSQELEYSAQLQAVHEHAILNNMLLLSLKDDGGMMFFVKMSE